ncbi:FG-GAP repeat protein [Dyella terrae]|nr:FG-GAP repeat protein [Dyella terrae]
MPIFHARRGQWSRWACPLLLLAVAFHARAEEAAIIQVDPQTQARVTLSPNRIVIRFLLSGKTQTLNIKPTDADGGYRLATDDFNFDGHQDVAIVDSYDGVTEGYQIFLFDPAGQRFVPLEVKQSGSCAGLSSVTVDPKSRTLFSACRGAGWNLDAYRYAADGGIYLYQSTEDAGIDSNPALERLFGVKQGDTPIGRLLTYDDRGRVIARVLAHRDSLAIVHGSAQVIAPHLPMYDKPGHGTSGRHLVRGDHVDVEDVSADLHWARVTYRNATKGSIEGWVNISGLSPR